MIPGLGTESAVVMGVMALTGLVTGWLGYRIRYHRDLHLIAGYRSGRGADEQALSRVVGGVVLVVAALTVAAGAFSPVVGITQGAEGLYWAAYTGIVLLLGGYAVVVSRRYIGDS